MTVCTSHGSLDKVEGLVFLKKVGSLCNKMKWESLDVAGGKKKNLELYLVDMGALRAFRMNRYSAAFVHFISAFHFLLV